MAIINRTLLIPKLHYFLSFGSMAGTLPFLMTMATQQGASMAMVGLIYSTLPFVVMIIKPFFGSLADKLQQKKPIFLASIVLMTSSLFALYFVPRMGDDSGAATYNANVSVVCQSDGLSVRICQQIEHHISNSTESHMDHINSSQSGLTWSAAPPTVSCLITCWLTNNTEPVFESWCNASRQCTPNPNLFQSSSILADEMVVQNESISRWLNLRADISSADWSGSNSGGDCRQNVISGFEVDGKSWPNSSCEVNGGESVLEPCHLVCDTDPNKASSEPGGGHSGGHHATIIDGAVFQLNRQIVFLWLCMMCAWIGMGVVVSLGDTIVLDLLDDKSTFGRQRLYGAVGWGSLSVLTGQMVDMASRSQSKLDFTPCYFVTLVVGALDLAFSSRIRVDRVERPRRIMSNVAKLFADPSVCVFALSVLAVGMLTGVLWTFLIVYLNELGASQLLVGLTLAVQCFLGEIPFFFISGWFLKKIGHAQAMSLVLLIFGARFVLYSCVTDPWLVLPVELTQGITYGIFFTALATYPSLIAPVNTQATVQGVFQSIFEGVGVGVGSFVGGVLYQSLGGKQMFFLCGLSSGVVAMLIGLLQFWLSRRSSGGAAISLRPARQDGPNDVKEEEMIRMCSTETPVA